MQHSKELITEDMTVGDVITKWPEVAEIFGKYGLSCIGCSVNTMEAIGVGARGHGMSDEEVEAMLKESNEFVSKKQEGSEEHEHEEPSTEAAMLSRAISKEITMTEFAAKKVSELMKTAGKENSYLRFGVLPGGCSGFTYQLEFIDSAETGDIIIEQHGVKIAISPQSMEKVGGTSIDYVEGLKGSGFKIGNPNSHGGCGCGKSFS